MTPVDSADPPESKKFLVNPLEANYWWRQNEPAGALLNSLMLLFIVIPIGLVLKKLYMLSFVVFMFMVPYGLIVRQVAVRAVRHRLLSHPEERKQFEQEGIISY